MAAIGRQRRTGLHVTLLVWLLASPATPEPAAQGLGPRYPTQRFEIADGLAHSIVRALALDGHGYLWIGTDEGLSRFDGYEFRTFATNIATPYINTLALGSDGSMWAGTNGGGAVRFSPDAGLAQSSVPPREIRIGSTLASNSVNRIARDGRGRMWFGTDDGLFRTRDATTDAGDVVEAVLKGAAPARRVVRHLLSLRDGGILAVMLTGSQWEIVAFDADGFDDRPESTNRFTAGPVTSAIADEMGALIVTGNRLVRYRRIGGRWQVSASGVTVPTMDERGPLLRDDHGSLWIGTERGLFRFEGDRWAEVNLPSPQGRVISLVQQEDGTQWIGTEHGLLRLRTRAIATWTPSEGLGGSGAGPWKIVGAGGRVLVAGRSELYEIRNDRVQRLSSLMPLLGEGPLDARRTDGDAVLLTSSRGLIEVPIAQIHAPHRGNVTSPPADSAGWTLTGVQAPTPFADRDGRFWMGAGGRMYVRDANAPGSPWRDSRIAMGRTAKVVFQDRGGRLWAAGNEALGLVQDDRVEAITLTQGLPEARPRAVFEDRRGWLWIGLRYRGVSVTRDPAAAQPVFQNLSTADGLSSNTVWCVCEDDGGRVYFGTGRGLDRLDPETGHIRHFTTADGLPGDVVRTCATDETGHLWVSTSEGVSRIDVRSISAAPAPPPVYFTRVQSAGEDLFPADARVSALDAVTLDADRQNLRIDFAALNLRGDRLTYQYRLGDSPWSAPSGLRSVNYARLAPGPYRFEVRAVSPEGAAGADTAVLAFVVSEPFWRRPWFMLVMLGAVAAAAYVRLRLRNARALELEQIRRRIAVDLHDDFGAGLVQIAVLSEVARRAKDPAASTRPLETIADLARDMRASLGDIVWSIDPRRDYLGELVVRVREIATNALEARGISVTFRPAPPEGDRVPLPPDLRRQLLLFCKEALTNAARHSGATAVTVAFDLAGRTLTVTVADNGCGLPAGAAGQGIGLGSLRERIERLGGSLEVESLDGVGLTLRARLSLG